MSPINHELVSEKLAGQSKLYANFTDVRLESQEPDSKSSFRSEVGKMTIDREIFCILVASVDKGYHLQPVAASERPYTIMPGRNKNQTFGRNVS